MAAVFQRQRHLDNPSCCLKGKHEEAAIVIMSSAKRGISDNVISEKRHHIIGRRGGHGDLKGSVEACTRTFSGILTVIMKGTK